MTTAPLECERILLTSPDVAATRTAAIAAISENPEAVISETGDPRVEEYATVVGDVVIGVVATNVGSNYGPKICEVTDNKLLVSGASPVFEAVLAERALRQISDPTKGGIIRKYITRWRARSRIADLELDSALLYASKSFMKRLVDTHEEDDETTPVEIGQIAGAVAIRAIKNDMLREAAEKLAA